MVPVNFGPGLSIGSVAGAGCQPAGRIVEVEVGRPIWCVLKAAFELGLRALSCDEDHVVLHDFLSG